MIHETDNESGKKTLNSIETDKYVSGESDNLSRMSLVCAATASVIGILVVLGWYFDNPILKSVIPSYVSMKANTAFAITFLGSSALILHTKPRNFWRTLTVIGLTLAATFIGVLTLTEYILKKISESMNTYFWILQESVKLFLPEGLRRSLQLL